MSDATTRIKTILTADSSNFEAGIKRAQQALGQAEGKFKQYNSRMQSSFGQIDKLGAKVGAAFAGYLAVDAILTFGKSVVELGGKLKDLSQETGIAAETLSALQVGLEQNGSSLDEFSSSVVKLNRNIAEAASGSSKDLLKTFDELGLSVTKLTKLTPEQQLFAVVQALGKVKDQGKLTKAGIDLFGKSFAGLIPVIKETNGNLAEFVKKSQNAGTSLKKEDIETLDKFGDALTKFYINSKNLAGSALAELIRDFKDLADALTDLSHSLDGTWVSQLGHLYTTMGKLAELRNPGSAFNYFPIVRTKRAFQEILELQKQGKTLDEAISEYNKKKEAEDKVSPDATGKNGNIITEAQKAKAKSLKDALDKMQREANRGIRDDQLTDLEKKLAQVDDAAKDLAKTYESELTPQEKKQIEAIKEAIKIRDIQAKQIKLADDIGDAFSDAFEKAFDGASKFGDILNDLLKDIEKIALKAAIIEPLKEAFSGIGRSIFNPPTATGSSGFGSIFSSIIDFLPSFATGTSNVPYDMTARIHKGEAIIPRQQAESMGGNANVTVNVINNTPAQVQTKQGSNGDLTVLIDNAVAKNMSKAGSRTNQALRAQGSRTLVRR